MNLRLLCLIDYICGFKNYRQIIEYTKDKWIDEKHHNLLKWARNAHNIIGYENELKLIYLPRE